MYQKIAEELCVIGERLGGERMRQLAPVYLFSVEGQDGDMDMTAPLEQLLENLEGRQLFSAQTDGCVTLFLEYGCRDTQAGGRLGFVDEAGKFKETLSQWMEYFMVSCRVSQGIVLIRLDGLRDQLAETVWWRRFFRQIRGYQGRFLFFCQTGREDADAAVKLFSGGCFCRTIELERPETGDYMRGFETGLKQNGLALDKEGRAHLRVILERHRDRITAHALRVWRDYVIWEYLLREASGDRQNTLSAEDLKEEELWRYINSERLKTSIGFEVTKDE